MAEFQGIPDGGVRVDRQKPLGVALPIGTWFHVVLDTTRTDATLTANGATVTMTGLIVPSGISGRSFGAGITYVSSVVQTSSLFIDNVDCIIQP